MTPNPLAPIRRPLKGPHKKLMRGKPIPQEKVIAINELRYEQGKSLDEIRDIVRVGWTVLDRALCITRDEWDKLKIKSPKIQQGEG